MLRSRKVFSTLLAASAILVAQVASADTSTPKSCQADAKKLCKGVKQGHGAILICLEKNADKLSTACAGSLTDKAQAVESACKPDLDKNCANVEAGGGRLLQCLAQHEADMTADCKAFWGAAKSKSKSTKK